MAIAENGPNGSHQGKIGNIVYYTLNGKSVARKIGRLTKPPTEGQLRIRTELKMGAEFFKVLKPFILQGFSATGEGSGKNYFNLAMEHNQKRMFKGDFPNLAIDYAVVLLSKGQLKPAENPQAVLGEEGLDFSWETSAQMAWPESTDQVMMLAYFPERKKVVYQLYGNPRKTGFDRLDIPPSLRGEYMEAYVSFVSADRKQVADSCYIGNFNL